MELPMNDDFSQTFNEIFNGIVERSKQELKIMTKADLERFWFFTYTHSKSKEWNLYDFTSKLELYREKCREWEEMHNGRSCVVERVRDTYLMPKIKQFIVDSK